MFCHLRAPHSCVVPSFAHTTITLFRYVHSSWVSSHCAHHSCIAFLSALHTSCLLCTHHICIVRCVHSIILYIELCTPYMNCSWYANYNWVPCFVHTTLAMIIVCTLQLCDSWLCTPRICCSFCLHLTCVVSLRIHGIACVVLHVWLDICVSTCLYTCVYMCIVHMRSSLYVCILVHTCLYVHIHVHTSLHLCRVIGVLYFSWAHMNVISFV